jgi:hypothetical protein
VSNWPRDSHTSLRTDFDDRFFELEFRWRVAIMRVSGWRTKPETKLSLRAG